MVGWFSQLPRTESASLLVVGFVLLAFMVGAWLSWREERAADRSKTVRHFTHVKAEEGEIESPI